jgi:Flp pilus assembly protein TadB
MGMFRRRAGKADVVRITGARSSLTEDVRGRQRRYMVSMAVRTLCVILAIVLWNESRIVAIIALVGGTLIPYLAVVYANAGRESAPDMPETFIGYQPPPMLGPGTGIPTQSTSSTFTEP